MKNFILISAAIVAASFSLPAMAQETPTLNVCTGGKGGNYEYTAKVLADMLSGTVNVQVVNTAGSLDNIKKINDGECDAAMLQSDAVYVYGKDMGAVEATKTSDMYREYVHLLCRRDTGIESLGDLNEKTKIMIGKPGSGANVTWRGMVLADKEFGGDFYSKIPTLPVGGSKTDLADLKSGEADCMVYVAAPGTAFMSKDANKLGADLVLIPVEDKDFDDPQIETKNGLVSIWNPAELPYKSYEKIMPSGMFGRKNVETVGVTAMFYISKEWKDANDDAYGEVAFAMPDVQKILKADKGLTLD